MMRIGHGYDVHRLVPGRKLMIGGVEIPHDMGLLGHSDADVLLHAVCDAVLGAIGEGDIGRHFPDSDPAYKGIDSRKLLDHVINRANQLSFVVSNIDATVIAERPKLAPHIETMVEQIAADCNIDQDRVNVKATTTEGLGFAGRQEGISAHAVVLMRSTEWAWRDFI
jgi:2-C-methyl-D-erythritol 2,4-cyclodiphosphate synthase